MNDTDQAMETTDGPVGGTTDSRVLARVRLPAGASVDCLIAAGVEPKVGQACIVALPGRQEWGLVYELAGFDGVTDKNTAGRVILRVATEEDRQRKEENFALEEKALSCFRHQVEKLKLDLRPLATRYSFDLQRLDMFFSFKEKADLQKLAYHLHREFPGVDIRLQPLGVREEAAAIGGCGTCGRRLCCSTWLHHPRNVNIRMARAQELSLNPRTVSGMCGRLKCCLRYEYGQYLDAGATFPAEGTEVKFGDETGKIIGREVLNGRIAVRTGDGRILHCKLCQVETVETPGSDGK